MNNYRLLNIVNPQFVYNIDCGLEKNNNKYMVVIPALVGYDKNVACAIYVKISEKLLDESTNNGLERLINDMNDDISILLRGYDDFIVGEDYFLSESLYDYILTELDDDPFDDSSDDSSYDDSSSNDDSSGDEPNPDPGYDTIEEYWIKLKGHIILHGPDVTRLLNINRYNIKRVSEILRLEELERGQRKKILIMSRPDISADVTNITDEEIDEIDNDNKIRYVMNDYVLYDPDLNFNQNMEAYKYLYDINCKDMRNLEWFYHMNNLEHYEFDRDELCNIIKTFCTIIIENAIVQNPETINNQIYDKVLRYYANGSWDDATIALNLLLNSTVPTTLASTRINCGCASDNLNGTSGNSDSINSCIDLYKNSMIEWLKNMLSNDEFYKDWFFTIISGMCPDPNVSMIDPLINLLQEYVDLNLADSSKFNPNRRYNIFTHKTCCATETDNTYNEIILNYIKVLKTVKNNEIDENKNMIKIYGEQFAEILPLLTCSC